MHFVQITELNVRRKVKCGRVLNEKTEAYWGVHAWVGLFSHCVERTVDNEGGPQGSKNWDSWKSFASCV